MSQPPSTGASFSTMQHFGGPPTSSLAQQQGMALLSGGQLGSSGQVGPHTAGILQTTQHQPLPQQVPQPSVASAMDQHSLAGLDVQGKVYFYLIGCNYNLLF